ncbi:hypothetical protein NP493_1744g00068 [Ridgeia piscesae]|uniref:Uncharacterized protein n=1 Tax=Ridgeia piscesae TaxID=27915 RepID=A0AAD9JUG9_RIDPI|nr:hypothetical protein NP493_1744g00068 [Ridgeia piscesae]
MVNVTSMEVMFLKTQLRYTRHVSRVEDHSIQRPCGMENYPLAIITEGHLDKIQTPL